ncbi:MAG: 50S ribosomal protein L13 [Muribaculaceae bacterium]|nr:50S ribosomal protein L13 [Muribaculaceae bacterium]
MNTLSYKTESVNAGNVQKNWVVIDATDQVLGRLCAKVALVLRGKHKPTYTPHVDCGDNVIIINADKVRLTGNKWEGREYVRYTGYPGGQRFFTPADLLKKSQGKSGKAGMHPLFVKVVKGMLPKNKLGAKLLTNLYVYNGENHPHEAQQPQVLDINKIK